LTFFDIFELYFNSLKQFHRAKASKMQKIFLFLLLSIVSFANIGTIMVAKGDAYVKRTQSMLAITNGMSIQKGDEIITKKRTRVQVMLNDDTVITIGPESSFSFLDYFFDGSKKSTIQMQANRGFFRSVTGQIGKIAPERFKVKTQLATIGIRGTDFSAQLGTDSASYICNRGEITLSFSQVQKSVVGGDKLLLHLDGLTVKELPEREIDNNLQVKQLLKKHNEQIGINANNILDITENKPETTNIKFNCDSH